MIKPKTLSQNEARQGSRRINASGFLFLCMTRQILFLCMTRQILRTDPPGRFAQPIRQKHSPKVFQPEISQKQSGRSVQSRAAVF